MRPIPRYEDDENLLSEVIRSVLRSVRLRLGMDVGFISEFDKGNRIFRYVDGENPPIAPGGADPLSESYCSYIVRGLMPGAMQNAADDPVAAGMKPTKSIPVGAHLSTPIVLPCGGLFGTLCCFSYAPNPDVGEAQLRLLQFSAEQIANLLGMVGKKNKNYLATEDAVRCVLKNRAISIVFQPIYRLSDDRIVGFEALARFPSTLLGSSPDKWFEGADTVGLGIEMEFLAVEEAVAGLLKLPEDAALSLNLSPASIASARFVQLFGSMPLDRIILEVTEHAAIEGYAELKSALEPFRKRGLRLAIDDVGAGYSSFRHVLDLNPDLIKLDISLIRGIDRDPGRQALASAISEFARRMDCEVVAEGVETDGELASLRAAGITKVQGYLISRPITLADVPILLRRYRSREGLVLRLDRSG